MWSALEERRLRRLLPHNTYKQIGERLGRTEKSVHVKAVRLGIAPRKRFRDVLAPEEKIAHAQLMKKGLNSKEAHDLIVKGRKK